MSQEWAWRWARSHWRNFQEDPGKIPRLFFKKRAARLIDDNNQQWANDVIQHIVDNNNTLIPSINLVFENDNIPVNTTNKNHNNIFL